MTDTIEALRPDLQLFSSAQEAYEAAMELEKKFRDKMGERERSLCVCLFAGRRGGEGSAGDEAMQVDTEMRVIRRGRN